MEPQPQINYLQRRISELERQNAQLQHTTPSARRWRNALSWILLVISLVIVVPAGLLVWLNRTLMDPQQYIKTVGPIIEQPEVQKVVSAKASDAVFSRVNVDRAVANALPEQAQFLAPPVTSQVKTVLNNQISAIVASQAFHTVWVKANERAQARFVDIAKSGRESPVVNVNDAYRYISDQLGDTRLAPLLNKDLPPKIGEIQIANVPALAKISHWAQQLSMWRWILLGGAIISAALAILAATNRRVATLRAGTVLCLAAVLTAIIMRITRNVALSRVHDPLNHDAAAAIWHALMNNLYTQAIVTFLVGLIIIGISWYLGESRRAVQARAWTTDFMQRSRARFIPEPERMPAAGFAQGHRRALEWSLVTLTVIVTLLLIPLSVGSLLVILIIALGGLYVVELFAVPPARRGSKAG